MENSTNSSSATPKHLVYLDTHSAGFLAWLAFSLTLSVVAAVAFLLFFAVFFSERKLRSGSGLLIGHLMLIQFLLCTLHFMFFIVVTFRVQTHHPITANFCHNVHAAYWVTLYAGAFSSLLLALNRLAALLAPHSYKFWTQSKVIAVCIVIPWLLGFGLSLLFYLGIGADFKQTMPLGSCGLVPNGKDYGFLVNSALGMHIPPSLVLLIYTVIFVKLSVDRWQQRRIQPLGVSTRNAKDAKLLERRSAVTKILFAWACWDLMCVVPIPVLAQWAAAYYYRQTYMQLWLRSLLYSASIPSPIMFFVLNADYRNGLGSLRSRMLGGRPQSANVLTAARSSSKF